MDLTSSTTTSGSKFYDGFQDGYESGQKAVVRDFNNRLVVWLLVGVFVGQVIGTYASQGIVAFLSIVGLIYLVDKIKKIPPLTE